MRWQGRRESDNIEDRRGSRTMRYGVGGVGGLILMVVIFLLGGDPRKLLEQAPEEGGLPDAREQSGAPVSETAEETETRRMIAVVLADTEDTWREIFRAMGKTYEAPTLVLFSDAVDSVCGFASAAVGPFYCPRDGKVYLDLGFYRELHDRFGASGDFAQAYVLAHEVGHHVQNLLGISDRVGEARESSGRHEANALSVRLELQADCLAGVWAHHADRAHQLLERGDLEEGVGAASAIGDDRIQMETRGYVAPDGFTHGSSQQRVSWFKRGVEGGTIEACDTFSREPL